MTALTVLSLLEYTHLPQLPESLGTWAVGRRSERAGKILLNRPRCSRAAVSFAPHRTSVLATELCSSLQQAAQAPAGAAALRSAVRKRKASEQAAPSAATGMERSGAATPQLPCRPAYITQTEWAVMPADLQAEMSTYFLTGGQKPPVPRAAPFPRAGATAPPAEAAGPPEPPRPAGSEGTQRGASPVPSVGADCGAAEESSRHLSAELSPPRGPAPRESHSAPALTAAPQLSPAAFLQLVQAPPPDGPPAPFTAPHLSLGMAIPGRGGFYTRQARALGSHGVGRPQARALGVITCLFVGGAESEARGGSSVMNPRFLQAERLLHSWERVAKALARSEGDLEVHLDALLRGGGGPAVGGYAAEVSAEDPLLRQRRLTSELVAKLQARAGWRFPARVSERCPRCLTRRATAVVHSRLACSQATVDAASLPVAPDSELDAVLAQITTYLSESSQAAALDGRARTAAAPEL